MHYAVAHFQCTRRFVMIQELKRRFKIALTKIENTDPNRLEITPATQKVFGDFQTNVAMQHAKLLKQNPRQIADNIIAELDETECFEKVEVVGPGFINIFLKTEFIEHHINHLSKDDLLGIHQTECDQPIIIDYSAPNVAKTMHVAHIRSTIIGDALKRIYRACGFKVLADNHIGDWGTQFGKLLYAYKNFDIPEETDRNSVSFLEKLYQQFVALAKEDSTLNDHARAEVASLQREEEPNYSLWQKFISISLTEFESVYSRLNVNFDMQRGESYYNSILSDVVEDLKNKNICRESEGAQVVFFDEDKLPPIPVQKSDGSYLYSTTDVATVKTRVNEFKPSNILYVTDNRQKLHFEQLFEMCSLLGLSTKLKHIPFGLMKFGAGTIMSTKEGQVISLKDLLDEAEQKAYQVLKDTDYSETEKLEIARVVGISAIKYQDLSQNPSTDITFTWDKALNLEGNSAPYLLYAYARIQAIYRKYEDQVGSLPNDIKIKITEEIEKDLCLQLFRFNEVIQLARENCRPNLIADYIYQLSSLFASFYNQASILRAKTNEIRDSRMALALLTGRVLKKGLNMLGIETLDRM